MKVSLHVMSRKGTERTSAPLFLVDTTIGKPEEREEATVVQLLISLVRNGHLPLLLLLNVATGTQCQACNLNTELRLGHLKPRVPTSLLSSFAFFKGNMRQGPLHSPNIPWLITNCVPLIIYTHNILYHIHFYAYTNSHTPK